MKWCTQLFVIAFALGAGLLYSQYRSISVPKALPDLDIDAYWGPGLKSDYKVNKAIIPHEIQYLNDAEKPIERLQKKLSKSFPLHPPLEGIGYQYGVNSNSFFNFLEYWRDDYLPRWSERETFLNRFPHFFTQIQGLNIHFIHMKATKPSSDTKKRTVIPVLLIHGWPGSVREFYELIPKLASPDAIAKDVVFEVVAPSLPGYGWSQGSSKTGFGIVEMSIVLHNLMQRLGYNEYYIQGGDWGSALGSSIATIFPKHILGYHSNMCFTNTPLSNIKAAIASFYPSAFVEAEHQQFFFPRTEKFLYLIEESGYMHLQATKPDTIGIVLSSNPIGLAAYIFEKFSTWTNKNFRELNDGGWSDFSTDFKDAILDNIMIYHLSNSITTSLRLYSEAFTFKQLGHGIDRVPTNVPCACSRFIHDLAHSMDWQLKEKYTNIVLSTYHNDGGHFAAMEQADLLFKDFATFVRKVRK